MVKRMIEALTSKCIGYRSGYTDCTNLFESQKLPREKKTHKNMHIERKGERQAREWGEESSKGGREKSSSS